MSAVSAKAENPIIPWWLVLLQGIAALIMGFLLVIKPGMTLLVLIQFLGIYWFVSGIFGIVSIFVDSEMWGWKLLSGILGVIAGVIIIQHPIWSSLLLPSMLAIILGVEGIIIGAINIVQAFKGAGWGIGLLGVLSILFGLILIFNPLAAGLALPLVMGIFSIVGGIAAIFLAFKLK